jgi:DNA invertase Pin-like site-specific DNA recombinase
VSQHGAVVRAGGHILRTFGPIPFFTFCSNDDQSIKGGNGPNRLLLRSILHGRTGLGDSERRQIEVARQYAEQQGFSLDQSAAWVDRGVSGYRGKNISEGALGEFIRRVKAGKIPKGSALLVENPDRISRQPFSECWPWYQEILKGGVELHFLSIHRVLSPKHAFADVLQIGVKIDRGNSESQMRSQRLAATWAEKKHHSAPGIVTSNKMPGWLDGKADASLTRVIRSKTKKSQRYSVNKRKAQIVKRIFEMAADGLGKRLIARRLNQKKVPTFGRAAHWGYSYVQKVLFNRAVLGEYAPHKGRGRHRQPDGEPRLEFYPPIITADLWQRAHRAIASRRTTSQKGKVTGKVCRTSRAKAEQPVRGLGIRRQLRPTYALCGSGQEGQTPAIHRF